MSETTQRRNRLTIIAEAGVNHNGDIGLAREMIHAAKDAGADVIKFQIFNPNLLASADAKTAKYQESSASTQRKLLSRLALKKEDYVELAELCKSKEIEFLATPFDLESFQFLYRECGVSRVKIGSGDSINNILLWQIAVSKLNLILSTGMTTIKEIKNSLNLLALGYSNSWAVPEIENGEVVELVDSEITQILKGRVTLLHAVSLYPTPAHLSNVRNIEFLKEEFGLEVGLSDHSTSQISSILALGVGAEVFEKHFTLDKSMSGPDHKASMSVEEMREWIEVLNESAVRFGELNRTISNEELEVRQVVRQHLIANQPIKLGEKFSLNNLTFTRTGGAGNQTSEVWRLLNQPASRSYNVGEPIDE